MSVESYIESLRAKPEHIRKRYAFWSALGITMVIFMFWLSSFSIFNSKIGNVAANVVNKTNTPTQSLVANVSSFFTDIKELIITPKKVKYSSIEAIPGKK